MAPHNIQVSSSHEAHLSQSRIPLADNNYQVMLSQQAAGQAMRCCSTVTDALRVLRLYMYAYRFSHTPTPLEYAISHAPNSCLPWNKWAKFYEFPQRPHPHLANSFLMHFQCAYILPAHPVASNHNEQRILISTQCPPAIMPHIIQHHVQYLFALCHDNHFHTHLHSNLCEISTNELAIVESAHWDENEHFFLLLLFLTGVIYSEKKQPHCTYISL